jgi:hypothetical protein
MMEKLEFRVLTVGAMHEMLKRDEKNPRMISRSAIRAILEIVKPTAARTK